MTVKNNQFETRLAVMDEKLKNITDIVTKIDGRLDGFLTRKEYDRDIKPIKGLVFGIVGIIGAAVLTEFFKLITK